MSVLVSTGLGLPAEDWEAVRCTLTELLPRGTSVVVVDRLADRAEDRAAVRAGGLLPEGQVRRLLDAAAAGGGTPPYVVVGHSVGGLYAEAFARLRPELTGGLVLVDADLPPDASDAARPRGRVPQSVGRTTASSLSAMLRGRRLRFAGPALRRAMVWSGSVRATDPLLPARREALYSDPSTLVGMLDEQLGYRALARAVAGLGSARPLPDVPVTLVAAARWGRPVRRRHSSWVNAQLHRAAALGADLVVADNAAHLVMLDAPDIVAQAIATTAMTAAVAAATVRTSRIG
jgi:pimeloyl-ACP methyl ester carboxylesterase